MGYQIVTHSCEEKCELATGDHYEIIDVQSLAGQEVLNVYVYQAIGADATAVAVGEVFLNATDLPLASVQSTEIQHIALTVNNLNDLADFASVPNAYIGNVVSDSLPAFTNYALRYVRTTRAVRNGQKRIAGVPESAQNQGQLSPSALIALNTLATALFGPIVSVTPAVTLIPKIWRRPKGIVPQAFFDVASIFANPNITSQLTRKFGVGA